MAAVAHQLHTIEAFHHSHSRRHGLGAVGAFARSVHSMLADFNRRADACAKELEMGDIHSLAQFERRWHEIQLWLVDKVHHLQPTAIEAERVVRRYQLGELSGIKNVTLSESADVLGMLAKARCRIEAILPNTEVDAKNVTQRLHRTIAKLQERLMVPLRSNLRATPAPSRH